MGAGGREVRVEKDAAAVAAAGARAFVAAAEAAVAARGCFVAALAGGRTPKALYEILASGGEPGGPPYSERVDWTLTWLLSGDERSVPPDHADSNYRMAYEALLSKVSLPSGHAIRFWAEAREPEACALHFETMVREALGLGPQELPRLDLVLLGMGPDGHTASLFPGTDALHAPEGRMAVANRVETLATWRFTLTAEAINRAREVVFLVTGGDKAETLREVLEGAPDPDRLPSQLIAPENGRLLWIVDEPAAERLSTPPR